MFLTTEYSHREVRNYQYDVIDYIDLFMIMIWTVYNGLLMITVFNHILQPKSYDFMKLSLTLISCICAIICLILNVLRKKLSFRNPYRNKYHICLHVIGSVGTMILLYVSDICNKQYILS